VKKLLAFVLVGAAVWFYFHEPRANWRGMPAAREPLQRPERLPHPFEQDGYTITPLARYQLTAVVLGRDRYRNDRGATLSPVDLALGWGPMSVASVINGLSISQSGRWYEYTWSGEPPLDPGLIATHSANTHCLPATAEVRRRLLEVKRHELVTMEGYLVEVSADDGYRWRSSLTRDDTGAGACEVFWITSLETQPL
jgi:hypothetical protein